MSKAGSGVRARGELQPPSLLRMATHCPAPLLQIQPRSPPRTLQPRELKSLPRPHPAQPRVPSCPCYPLQNLFDLYSSTESIPTCEFPPPCVTPVLWLQALPLLWGAAGPGEEDKAQPAPTAQSTLGAEPAPTPPHAPHAGVATSTLHPSRHTGLPLHSPHPGAAAR